MRSFLLKLHLYGGLLCSSYLIIFGISSLNYNHNFGKPGNEKLAWERSLKVVDIGNDLAVADAVRDALGLVGWSLPWEMRRDDQGNLHFGVSRPGKHYAIHVFFDENQVKVEETRRGFWAIINSLHGNMGVPASRFMNLWGAYTELCTWVVLFSAASGVYLWTRRRKERIVGWLLLVGGTVPSLLLMFYVWWRG
jgi:hypothetical protein